MTREEKNLLLRDLCGRLLYGVKVWRQGGNYVVSCLDIEKQSVYLKVDFEAIRGWWTDIEEVKPYLRPMSSMMEEEKELMKGSVICFNELEGNSTLFDEIGLDWLNAHHFDYRGLLEKNLALEAPEGMYN